MSAQVSTNALHETPEMCAALNVGNSTFNSALKMAMGALFILDAQGSTVLDIEIRSGTPILTIDNPPASVQGSWSVTRTVRGVQERVMVARLNGAQLEWVHRQTFRRTAGGAR
jgi:hypothetical protein